jgi:siroheme synthase-like protein
VFRAASRARIFANIVDQKPLCSFIAPAIVRKGKLTIAISTNGTSPAVAKHLRRRLEQTLAGEYAPLLRFAAQLRPQVQRRLTTYAQRRRYFDQLLEGRAATLLRAGKRREAREEALALLRRW